MQALTLSLTKALTKKNKKNKKNKLEVFHSKVICQAEQQGFPHTCLSMCHFGHVAFLIADGGKKRN